MSDELVITEDVLSAPAVNGRRVLIRALREIAAERGIAMSTFSYDWIVRLELAGRVRFVFGYDFDVNTSVARLLAGDKSAAAEVMAAAGLPCIEHRLLLRPQIAELIGAETNRDEAMAFAAAHGFRIVCKPNDGTGGIGVTRTGSSTQLERAIDELLIEHRAVCLSPRIDIDDEFRLIMLAGRCELAYRKWRAHVVGDGRSTLGALISAYEGGCGCDPSHAAHRIAYSDGQLAAVPPAGSVHELTWTHNLACGATPQPIDDESLLERLTGLSDQAADALGVTFASVDIVRIGGELSVLEVNPGVMLERYARQAEHGYETAVRIYGKVVDRMFSDSNRGGLRPRSGA